MRELEKKKKTKKERKDQLEVSTERLDWSIPNNTNGELLRAAAAAAAGLVIC